MKILSLSTVPNADGKSDDISQSAKTTVLQHSPKPQGWMGTKEIKEWETNIKRLLTAQSGIMQALRSQINV